jgi:phage shock protein PspC (stress-responsive transcriptional regulator)
MTATAAPAADLAKHQDNLFGVCAAIGEDFGFNPLWLRIAFACGLLFSLEGVIAAYAALGMVVLLSRLIAPKPKAKPQAEPVAEAPKADVVVTEPLRQAA